MLEQVRDLDSKRVKEWDHILGTIHSCKSDARTAARHLLVFFPPHLLFMVCHTSAKDDAAGQPMLGGRRTKKGILAMEQRRLVS